MPGALTGQAVLEWTPLVFHFSAHLERRQRWPIATCGSSSKSSRGTGSCTGSPRRWIRCWRSPRSPIASRVPGARPCCLNVRGLLDPGRDEPPRQLPPPASGSGGGTCGPGGSAVAVVAGLPQPAGLMDKLKLLGRLQELDAVFPRRVRSGPCQQVVRREEFSLDELPILKCWPKDGGRYITWPLVFTRDPETGQRNVGVYRMQVLDGRTTAMHWQTQKHGAEHFRHTRRLQRPRLEVAVAIGADPVTCLAGVLPAPPGVDELLLAGFLRKEPVELVRCITVDLEVPAEAEIVLEGYVDPTDLRTEGPFGDHTGFYSLEGLYPAFHLT